MFEHEVDRSAPGALGTRVSREELTEFIGSLSTMDVATDQGEAIERIRVLEELKAACAAAQARESDALYIMRCDAEAQDGVPVRERGRGVSAEIALARRDAPSRGGQHLGLARTLVTDLPNTMKSLSSGEISEWTATVVCQEVICLDTEHRQAVDELIKNRLGQVSLGRLRGLVRGHVQRLDQAAVVARREREEKQRRVSVRPAPGDMAYLTALMPLKQAVAIYATLSRDAATMVGSGAADGRTQAQTMADLLVERATGQSVASAVPAEIQLVMTDKALFGGGDTPAWIPGHGPIPASTGRQWVGEESPEVFLRRLYADPTSGQLVSMESRRREFPPGLRRLIVTRDDVCRTPFCDAPIRHLDHAQSASTGGETTWANGSGLCAQCNYLKENRGWQHNADADRLEVITPTGHRYEHHTLAQIKELQGADPPQISSPAEHLLEKIPLKDLIPDGWVKRVNVE